MIEQENDNPAQIDTVTQLEVSPEQRDLIRGFGHIGLESDVRVDMVHAPLPEGYQYAEPDRDLIPWK